MTACSTKQTHNRSTKRQTKLFDTNKRYTEQYNEFNYHYYIFHFLFGFLALATGRVLVAVVLLVDTWAQMSRPLISSDEEQIRARERKSRRSCVGLHEGGGGGAGGGGGGGGSGLEIASSGWLVKLERRVLHRLMQRLDHMHTRGFRGVGVTMR